MKPMKTLSRALLCVVVLNSPIMCFANSDLVIAQGVSVAVEPPRQAGSLFHWKIKNSLDTAVYVYDFYLWGPALHVSLEADRAVFETSPVRDLRSCPPNRFPPVLLLAVGPGRTIEGDFVDSDVKDLGKRRISLQIAVGKEPYSVVTEAKRFYNSKCRHNPYDAIFDWGTLIESLPIQLSDLK